MAHSKSSDKTGSEIPGSVMRRLPIYQRYLTELSTKEAERISSSELAAKMRITASQLRQDLNWFGSFGQQGYGYRVEDLLREVNRILGLEEPKTMILVGAGHLGRAILNYSGFPERQFVFNAVFDNDPRVIGTRISGIEVAPLTRLVNYLVRKKPQIGVITTPASAAQEIASVLAAGGVGAIWNFAPVALKVPPEVIVEDVYISESLLMLSFRMRQQRLNNEVGGKNHGNGSS